MQYIDTGLKRIARHGKQLNGCARYYFISNRIIIGYQLCIRLILHYFNNLIEKCKQYFIFVVCFPKHGKYECKIIR